MAIVSRWSMNGDATDSLGTNNGTASNVTYVAGKTNQSGSFNGSTSYISAADSASLDILGDITLSAIINPTALKNSYFFTKDSVTSNRTWTFDTTNYGSEMGKLDALFFVGANYSYAKTTNQNVLVAGKYQHVLVTRKTSDGAVQFWINGNKIATTQVTTSTGNMNNSNALVYLGKRAYGPSPGVFNGTLDEMEVFNNQLTDGEIKTKYAYLFGFM